MKKKRKVNSNIWTKHQLMKLKNAVKSKIVFNTYFYNTIENLKIVFFKQQDYKTQLNNKPNHLSFETPKKTIISLNVQERILS